MLWSLISPKAAGAKSPVEPLETDSTKLYWGKEAKFSMDPAGFTYVLDMESDQLMKLSTEGKLLQSIGGYGWSEVSFDQPADVSSPNGLDVYVADYGNHRIQHFDRNLNFVSTLFFRDKEDVNERFGYPRSVAVSRLGELFLIDGENIRIVKVVDNNTFDRAFGGQGSGKGRLQNPSRVRVSITDQVYVQDGNTLKLFDVFGNYIRTIGEGMFSSLRTFTLDRKNVYVLDSCTLRVFDEHGSMEDSTAVTPPLTEGCDINDIAVQGSTVYFLGPHHVSVSTLQTFNRSQR